MHERKDKWTVGQWMTPNPQAIKPRMSVRSAFFTMRHDGFRHLPVVEDGRLVGIVTDRDLRRPDMTDEPDGWHDFYQLDDEYEVRHVMTLDPVTVSPGDALEKVLDLVIERKFGALPVVDKTGQLIGILTSYDLHRAFREALAQAGESLREVAA